MNKRPFYAVRLIVLLMFTTALAFAGPTAEQPAAGETPRQATTAAAKESPMLQALVASGQLPLLARRLPERPLVLEPVERVGKYGGTWRSGLLGGQDNAWLVRTIDYEHLVRWSPDWKEVVPNVAESFETNADATVFTFRLRKGMK